jgi:hypothetical protein
MSDHKNFGKEIRIVFCHLSKEIPLHLRKNLERTRLLFPANPISLIGKPDSIEDDFLFRNQIDFVQARPHPRFENLISGNPHDLEFRKGFWKYSLERIFCLCDLSQGLDDEPILHIESDVMLFKDFPLDLLTEMSNLAWGLYNEHRDVASLMFVKDKKHAFWLEQQLYSCLENNIHHTDMTILKEISEKNPTVVRYFPMYLPITKNLKSKVSKVNLNNMLQQTMLIEGIFDSASIGMWLTGQDGRNLYGFKRLFSRKNIDNGDSLIDPSIPIYRAHKDGKLIAEIRDKAISIFCLHVHSKNQRIFGDKENKIVSRIITFGSLINNREVLIFDIKAFTYLTVEKTRKMCERFFSKFSRMT